MQQTMEGEILMELVFGICKAVLAYYVISRAVVWLMIKLTYKQVKFWWVKTVTRLGIRWKEIIVVTEKETGKQMILPKKGDPRFLLVLKYMMHSNQPVPWKSIMVPFGAPMIAILHIYMTLSYTTMYVCGRVTESDYKLMRDLEKLNGKKSS